MNCVLLRSNHVKMNKYKKQIYVLIMYNDIDCTFVFLKKEMRASLGYIRLKPSRLETKS